ncbi:MAG: prepilin-type N-terminal cleavage/methylation domain-containing protein [Candidatus Peregrinibacteria bacterium]|nr:prepilin-type N-terminal cleavage/methylation domain-containing protein [Candidatus Peregrinibacteria bacterium]MDZ4244393.1 prepilin-type N-terminal cleavage/methylation domain-containing protein [Candidatus Gracilibacteria bacterium]
MKKKGFTLLELILVIAIFSIVVGGTILSLSSFFAKSQLTDHSKQIVNSLRKAQSNSMMRVKVSQWGVNFDSGGGVVTFFQGASYSARDTNYDQAQTLPPSLSLNNISFDSGGTEVVFTKVNGETDDFGSLQVQGDIDNYTITINKFGQIEIN